MESKFYFCLILALVCISVNCFSNNHQKYEQDSLRHSSLSRFRRQSPVLGYKNYMQAAVVQPSVVVMPNGVPNIVYGGPGSSYGVPTTYGAQSPSYGVQRVSYGDNRVPTVVVNMPDDNYITPVVNNPYAVPVRRL